MADTEKPTTTKPSRKRVPAGSSIDFPSVPGRRQAAAALAEPTSISPEPETQTSAFSEIQESAVPETQIPGDPDILDAESTDATKSSTSGSRVAGTPEKTKVAGTVARGARPEPEPEPEPDPVYTIKRTYNMTTDELTAVANMQTAALRRSGKKPDTSTIVRLAVRLFNEQPNHIDILLAHSRDSAKAKEQRSDSD